MLAERDVVLLLEPERLRVEPERLPLVIDAVRTKLDERARKSAATRTTNHRKVNRDSRLAALREAVEVKRAGWDASPIATARIYGELWSLIKDHVVT